LALVIIDFYNNKTRSGMKNLQHFSAASVIACLMLFGCQQKNAVPTTSVNAATASSTAAVTEKTPEFTSTPLVTHIYTADPSAHVFNGKIYIYPSHDIETGVTQNGAGDHFDMKDVHVLSMDTIDGEVKDNGEAINLKDIPWAGRQLWAPDAAEKNGNYYLYYPVKDKQDIFRIGVGVSDSPTGPFKAEPDFIKDSFSVDPAVFKDTNGSHYMYFGGIWGGQLQHWTTGAYSPADIYPENDKPALAPKVAKLNGNMLSFAEKPRDLQILDKDGKPITYGDKDRRFFEGSWMHIYKGKYYFSYSTGDTHRIVYATGDNPYGPFIYQGVVLEPVLGWTSQHSIVEFQNKWYLFYHDSSLSGGQTHLRSVKMAELHYNPDGTIRTLSAFKK
jgi:hypothetical protein